MMVERQYILLVEDNPDDVALTVRALKKNAILNEVVVVTDGEEALDFLFARGKHAGRSAADMPAVVLLDLRLPKLDGMDVLTAIRKDPRTKMLPVVVLTSSDEQKDIVKSYELGVNSYVRKPVEFNEFAEAVKQLGLYWLLLNVGPPKKG